MIAAPVEDLPEEQSSFVPGQNFRGDEVATTERDLPGPVMFPLRTTW